MLVNENNPAYRWYFYVENADTNYLRMKIGRVLSAGETFYVDGVRYDIPAVYVAEDGGFKYITFQSPIPKGEPVWQLPLYKNVDDFSHVTSQYLAKLPEGNPVWVLPPFNDDHQMIDDIGLEKFDTPCIKVPVKGMLLEDMKEALEFYYIDETVEPRFDTSLTERLHTEYFDSGSQGYDEDWIWYNVYTLPNRYTEFILPNQERSNENYVTNDYPNWYPQYIKADGNEYLITSSLVAPNSKLDLDRTDLCKIYDDHEIFSYICNIIPATESDQNCFPAPRYVFEFDANDGTGFFINENEEIPTEPLPPTAEAGGPYSGDIGDTICFDGSNSYDNDQAGASIVQYDWKFYSTDSWRNNLGPTPCYTYTAAGTYTVTLRVTDNEGQTDTDTAVVTISSIPSTDSWIIMEDVCVPLGGTEFAYLRATGITTSVGSCEVTLSWNPAVASIVKLDHSDFESFYYYMDNVAGTVTIISSNTNVPLSGDFNIARIEFQAVGGSDAQCSMSIIDSMMLSDHPIPVVISHNTKNGMVYVDCSNGDDDGDMNGDGNVNSADVRYLALHLAGNPSYAVLHSDGDVNSDGNVNSADVRYLALYLAGNPAYTPLYP
jgi:PKD repeat protein